MYRYTLVALVCAWLGVACADSTTTPETLTSLENRQAEGRTATVQEEQLEVVASWVDMAFDNPGVRTAVYEAMLASPWRERKIVLPDFLTTEGGEVLRRAILRAGVSQEQLTSAFTSLPPLDLYIPFPIQRREWKGSATAAVLYTMDPDDVVIHGLADGEPLVYERVGGQPPSLAFVLHPAETKIMRRGLQLASGLSASATVAASVDAYTYLDYWKVLYNTEIGAEEPKFVAKFYDPDPATDSLIANGSYVGSTAGGTSMSHVNHAYWPERIPEGSPAQIVVNAWEDDTYYDDWMGSAVVEEADRNVYINTYVDGVHKTQFRLDWEPAGAPILTEVHVPNSASVDVGSSVDIQFKAYDQYGYTFFVPSSGDFDASFGSPSIASIAAVTSYPGWKWGHTIDGLEPGDTNYYLEVWSGADTVTATMPLSVEDTTSSGGCPGCPIQQ